MNSKRAIVVLAATFFALFSEHAKADWGERALRIECDSDRDYVSVEPFIIWNEEYDYNGTDISVLKHVNKAVVKSAIYYVVREPDTQTIVSSCQTKNRTITITLKFRYQDRKLDIEEKGISNYRASIDLWLGVGHAWDVWGPTYILTSEKSGNWLACVGRQDQSASTCTQLKGQ